jgi:hypothetical protein
MNTKNIVASLTSEAVETSVDLLAILRPARLLE